MAPVRNEVIKACKYAQTKWGDIIREFVGVQLCLMVKCKLCVPTKIVLVLLLFDIYECVRRWSTSQVYSKRRCQIIAVCYVPKMVWMRCLFTLELTQLCHSMTSKHALKNLHNFRIFMVVFIPFPLETEEKNCAAPRTLGSTLTLTATRACPNAAFAHLRGAKIKGWCDTIAAETYRHNITLPCRAWCAPAMASLSSSLWSWSLSTPLVIYKCILCPLKCS